MIVADTNLVSYLLIEGERTGAARGVWQRDPDWILPPFWRSEFLNVLVMSVRHGILTEEKAVRAWETGTGLLARSEREPRGEAVLRAALRHEISAYDAQFVVLAERVGARLVTGDRKLARACPRFAVSIEDFARGK